MSKNKGALSAYQGRTALEVAQGVAVTIKTGRAAGQSMRPSRGEEKSWAARSGPVIVVKPPDNPDNRYDMSQERYAWVSLRLQILKRDKYQCRYCACQLSNETANIDHVVPFKHGGRTTQRNLVACCLDCNKAKGNRLDLKPKPLHKARGHQRLLQPVERP